MGIEALYDMSKMYPYDLFGILVSEVSLCGVINNYPLRRKAVPYESMDMFANNNRTLRVYVKSPDLSIINVAGATGVFTLKETKESPSYTFKKSTAVSAEGAIGSPDAGEMFFYILPVDTVNLTIRQYVFDVKVTLSTGKAYTVVEGVLNLQQPVG